jgi:hypothetical protein
MIYRSTQCHIPEDSNLQCEKELYTHHVQIQFSTRSDAHAIYWRALVLLQAICWKSFGLRSQGVITSPSTEQFEYCKEVAIC